MSKFCVDKERVGPSTSGSSMCTSMKAGLGGCPMPIAVPFEEQLHPRDPGGEAGGQFTFGFGQIARVT